MVRILFFVVLFVVIFLFLRHKFARTKNDDDRDVQEPERMVKCDHCGVNLPISESVFSDGHYYCSLEHRDEARVK